MFKKFIDKIAGSREKVPPCFSGVIDPIIVRWEDGSYHSSPFCLRPGNVITKSNIIIDGESYGRIYLKVNNKLMDF